MWRRDRDEVTWLRQALAAAEERASALAEDNAVLEFRVVEFGLRVQIADMAAQNARLRQEVAARDWLADPVHRAAYEAARRAVEEVDRGD